MTWTYAFATAKPAGRPLKELLGGKGASLAEMTAAGLPVPPGFTIITDACPRYLAAGRLEDDLLAELRDQVAALEAATDRRFGAGARPLLVSVRSGAAASMPGMMDTVLNCGLLPALADEVGDDAAFWGPCRQAVLGFARIVGGIAEDRLGHAAADRAGVAALIAAYERIAGRPYPATPWAMLTACVEAVFRSWTNDRAEAYRKRHGIGGLAGTAVTVQAMWPSIASGVLFTRDPSRPEAATMVIEGSYGLGESVVSGDVTPDRFILTREPLALRERTLGSKTAAVLPLGERCTLDPAAWSLDDARVLELAELGMRVERLIGKPVDVEWGLADGRLALLQARPIRGLEVMEAVEPVRQSEIRRLAALADSKPRVWVAHNLGETLRAPTPMTWALVSRFMSGSGGFGTLYRTLGYRPSVTVLREGFLELICGRIYADPQRLAGLFWGAWPFAYDLDLVRRDPRALERPPTIFQADRADAAFLASVPGTLLAMRRCTRQMRALRRAAEDRFRTARSAWTAWLAQRAAVDLDRLDDAALLAELDRRVAETLDRFSAESLLPGFFGGEALGALSLRLGQLLGERDGAALAGRLTQALDGDATAEQNRQLWQVAHGTLPLASFMTAYGHRCSGEMELATPRWNEDPQAVERLLAPLRRPGATDPEAAHHRNRTDRDAAEAALPDLLHRHGGMSFAAEIRHDLADARRLLPYRETGKYELMRGWALIRSALEAIAARHDLGRGVYFLTPDELPRLATDGDAMRAVIAERQVRWQALQRLDPDQVVDAAALDRLGQPPEDTGGDSWAAEPVSPGLASGPVRIVFDPRTAGDLGSGYILVCPSTDPGWTPLFLGARGLIVERGGVLSHGAIVARDFGIPAVCLPGATRLLAGAGSVRIDANQGRVSKEIQP